ncbi:MAG: RHS repeat protein [Aquificaceae bacterium]|nr:RHS repeat protein [Aquificaceae bacterium]
MKAITEQHSEYNFDNRLVKIVYPDGRIVRFGYDGLGR